MRPKRNKLIALAAFLVTTLSTAQLYAQKQNDEPLLRAREAVWRAWFARRH